jgi:hypothetical protein
VATHGYSASRYNTTILISSVRSSKIHEIEPEPFLYFDFIGTPLIICNNKKSKLPTKRIPNLLLLSVTWEGIVKHVNCTSVLIEINPNPKPVKTFSTLSPWRNSEAHELRKCSNRTNVADQLKLFLLFRLEECIWKNYIVHPVHFGVCLKLRINIEEYLKCFRCMLEQ